MSVLDWSEAWAALIPLVVLIFNYPKDKYLRPVVYYIIAAFILNVLCDMTPAFYNYMPFFLRNNNFLYNIHSVCRLFLFIWFFNSIDIHKNIVLQKIIAAGLAIIILSNFIFIDSFFTISSKTFALESFVLLCYCIHYFFWKLQSDVTERFFDAPLIIITGLAVYEAVCFFIFLFYDVLMDKYRSFAVNIWNAHNVMYIIFCLFIARAFYGSKTEAA